MNHTRIFFGIMTLSDGTQYVIKEKWVDHGIDWCILWRCVYEVENGVPLSSESTLQAYRETFPEHYEIAPWS